MTSSPIQDALGELEAQLRRHAPEIAAALRPGLPADRLNDVLRRLPFETPAELRELYLWHDGTQVIWADDRAELFPGGQMLPIDEALKAMDDAKEGGGSSWDGRWLPIFTDNMGGWHVVDCAEPLYPILELYIVDLPDTGVAFADLQSMVDALIRRWQTGAFEQGEKASVVADPRAVAALYRTEDQESPNLEDLVTTLDRGQLQAYVNALALMRTRLYPGAVPGLIRLLESGTERGRQAAAELLGSIGDPMAEAALQHAAQSDSEQYVRVLAQESLQHLTR